jgi:glycosyltransferase involved in cell wall biosynthesis
MRVALVTLGDPGRLTGGYLYHRRMADRAPQHDARVEFVSLPDRGLARFKLGLTRFKLPFPLPALAVPRLLSRLPPCDVLLLDSIAAAYVGPSFALRPPRRALAAILHQPPGGIDHGPMRTAFQARLDRLAYRHARLLLVASDSLADELAAAGMPRDRLRIVPPGRDVAPPGHGGTGPGHGETGATAAGQPLPDLRQGRRAAILCVGNWVKRKGIQDLLAAFATLPPDLATLHLAGDDRADPRYAARIRRMLAGPDLASRVVVHGPLSVEEVAMLYRAADIFALPSRKEPYGTVYGEAMAAGLPVAGWRAGNLPYLAEDGKEGLLAEPGDIAGLAKALERLAEDEAWRRRLGAAAATRARTRPTWDESAAMFFSALRQVVGE